MLSYLCDWCRRPKRSGERWILGFAAQRVGCSGVQREISIAAAWSEAAAKNPFAVHFCCERHRSAYITALFDEQAGAAAETRGRRVRRGQRYGTSPSAVETLAEDCALEDPSARAAALTSRAGSPAGSSKRKRRRPAHYAAADEIRSHGLSVHLGGDSITNLDDFWSGT